MSKATKKTIIFTLIALAEIFIIGLVPAESALISRAGWQYIGIFVALLTLSISNAMPGFAIGLLCLTAIALFNIAPYYNKFWLEAQHPAGLFSISCLSYNKGSNWLTNRSLGFHVRRKDCQPSPCCSVRFKQVEP